MKLLRKPIKPTSLRVTPVLGVTHSEMPDVWLPYCDPHGPTERVA